MLQNGKNFLARKYEHINCSQLRNCELWVKT